MILSDKMIKAAIETGDIVIDPFDPKSLGTNSYDVHLGSSLMMYIPSNIIPEPSNEYMVHLYVAALDCAKEQSTLKLDIGPEGFLLHPNKVYLAVTQEYTETKRHVPFLDGKSSIGRLGIFIHCTAGRGDVGFCNHWTLEIVVAQPVLVYAGMPIGQLIYFETGEVDTPYDKKPNAKYNERCAEPQPSAMWRNFK